MSNKSDFRLSLGQILVRLSPLLLLGVVAFGEAVSGARGYRPYEVGSKAIIYDTRAKKIVLKDERIRVLASTLENAGGLVAVDCVNRDADRLSCLPLKHFAGTSDGAERQLPAGVECDTQLLVADAWEGLSAFCFERTTPPPRKDLVARVIRRIAAVITGGPEVVGRLRAASVATLLPSTRQTCPESECLDVQHGGVAVDDAGDITLAEPHTDRITTFRLGLRPPSRLRDEEVIGTVQYSGRAGMLLHDVARVPDGGLVVAESSSTDPKLSSVRLLMTGAPTLELVSGMYAPHPVGLWFSRDTQRLYVTDVSQGVQRWMYVERAAGQWSTPRTFWTAAAGGSEPQVLRHLITGWNDAATGEESPEIVFAGGSDGLYVIDPAGLLLAKYSLGRPLSGVDWGQSGELFFSSGRFIGVLRVAEGVQPMKGYTSAAGPPVPGPNPVQTPPAPSPSQPVDTPTPVTKAATVKPPPPEPAGHKPQPKKPRPKPPVTPSCICR